MDPKKAISNLFSEILLLNNCGNEKMSKFIDENKMVGHSKIEECKL